MKTIFALTVAAAATCFLAPHADAATVTIDASKDATIVQNNPNNASNAGNGLIAGTNGMNSPRRALIAFDVSGNVPAGSTIQSVELKLVLGQVAGGGTGDQNIEVHYVRSPWTDGQGQGAGALAGDVTWNASTFPSPLRTTAGGDFSAAASAVTAVGSAVNATFSWSSATLASEVQGGLDSPGTNNGWLLRNAVENVATNFRGFYSRDVATAAFFPKLAMTYFIPEPAGLALVVTIGATLSTVRRRRRASYLLENGAVVPSRRLMPL